LNLIFIKKKRREGRRGKRRINEVVGDVFEFKF
jgi:hypothetical protein